MHSKYLYFIPLLFFALVSCQKDPHDCPPQDDCTDSSLIDPHSACYQIYDPVCGCDGNTYGNSCIARSNGVKKWTQGACQTTTPCIDSSRIDTINGCYAVYDPVCGCDGVTYPNACEARMRGLTGWSDGACTNALCFDTALVDLSKPIPAVYRPVCGCDGKTYDNEQLARYRHGLGYWSPGPCNP